VKKRGSGYKKNASSEEGPRYDQAHDASRQTCDQLEKKTGSKHGERKRDPKGTKVLRRRD